MPRRLHRWMLASALALLAGCGSLGGRSGPMISPEAARARIAALLPARLADREGWADDIQSSFQALELPPTDEHICAVLAVTEQETGFRVDPPVPNLASIALKEIEDRAARLHVPAVVVRTALGLRSPTGETYRERIDKVRTERQLSEIYEDFISQVPLGRRLLAGYNPVRTGGPMQVSIAFAEQFTADHRHPWSGSLGVRQEVFTRRGGMCYGMAHLLAYPARYDAMLYRFADFNAGRYASRNAAFQNALSIASGVRLALDGDLLIDGGRSGALSNTERAVRNLAAQLGLDADQIHRDLARGDREGFEDTSTWRGVFELAARRRPGHPLPQSHVPQIQFRSPKITRQLTTEWFARRVDDRYQRCMTRAATLPR